jgi:outer membrane protein OmpA-like peptidoglycan-associated protein
MAAGAGPRRAAAPGDALGELRSLLFGQEAGRIEALEAELRALAASRLPRAELSGATAQIIAEALREAEVTRHRELADALAPLIVAAIRAEIRNSRESIVEALYPLMGRLVSAAVADAFRRLTDDLADRIDALISTRRWRWRLKSWATGRPMSEIALAEARRARVLRVIALERGSGAPIAVWPQTGDEDGRSGLVSGLIAAITEFAAETFAHQGGALRALDLGPRRVLLRSSATLIVAAECEGEVSAVDEAQIDDAFLALLRRHERTRELTAADLSTMESAIAPPQDKPGRAATWALRLAGWALVFGLAAWALSAALDWRKSRAIHAALEEARRERPQIQAYPLTVEVDHKARRATLRGLAPSTDETERVVAALSAVAAPYALEANVETIATDPALVRAAAELDARAKALVAAVEANQAALDARVAALDAGKAETRATLDGLAVDMRARQNEAAAAAQSLARDVAELRAKLDAPPEKLRRYIETAAIFFTRNAELADPAAAGEVADRLAALIKQTGLKLRVVGHTDDTGSAAINLERSRERAEAVVKLLTERGVPTQLLGIASRRAVLPISDAAASNPTPNRRVTFEFSLAGEPGQ